MSAERITLKGSDGRTYGEIIDGVLVIASRQSHKFRTTDYERWDLATGRLVGADHQDDGMIDMCRLAMSGDDSEKMSASRATSKTRGKSYSMLG